jgi:hypothetical protein
MSYSISVSGHKDVETPEEGRTFGEGIVEEAKKFVAALEGVTSASGSFGSLGYVDLRPKED